MKTSRPTLYLHIGAAKSGSSAIQLMLRRNSAALRQRGVLVPAWDLRPSGRVDGAQVDFFERLLPIDARAISLVGQRLFELADYLRSQDLRAAVVSAENLFNTDEFARLFVAAQDEFQVHVILYIRRQDDYIIGAWNQWYFKTNADFSTWVADVLGGIANWDVIVQRLEQRLPQAILDVRIFDRHRFPDGDIAADFLAAIGVDRQSMTLDTEPINRSLNEVAMRVAMRNRHLFAGAQDHDFLEFLASVGGRAAYEAFDTGLYFSAQERRDLLETYAASNERLRARYFPELPEGALFPEPADDKATPADRFEVLERELDLLWSTVYAAWRTERSNGRRNS